jgi:DNA-binding NarL/FixJ family response regulator
MQVPANLPEQQTTIPAARRHPLTEREYEVATLVATGLTNRQVARQLGIAEWTAVNHVRNVMRKLDCASRVNVAAWIMLMSRDKDLSG